MNRPFLYSEEEPFNLDALYLLIVHRFYDTVITATLFDYSFLFE